MCIIVTEPADYTPEQNAANHVLLPNARIASATSPSRYCDSYRYIRLPCSSCTRTATWVGKRAKTPPAEKDFVCAICKANADGANEEIEEVEEEGDEKEGDKRREGWCKANADGANEEIEEVEEEGDEKEGDKRREGWSRIRKAGRWVFVKGRRNYTVPPEWMRNWTVQ